MFVGEYDSGQFVLLIVRKRFRAKPVQAFSSNSVLKQAHTDASPESLIWFVSSSNFAGSYSREANSRSAFSSGLSEPSFGEIELKTTGKSVSHKAPNCAIYRSDRNSVRCRTFPATSASQDRLRVPDALPFGRPHTRALPQSRSCSE